MSKMDNLRAMRETKYAEALKRSAATAKGAPPKAASTTPKGTTSAPPKAATDAAADTPAAAEPARCGHRNMSGRSCTREHGHAAKSHRYS